MRHKDKNILITGITGFIGSNLASRFQKMGLHVFGVSRTFEDEIVDKIDIRNFKEIDRFIREKQIDICFHLAGESLVEVGQNNPRTTYDSNITGALNILESARINNLEKVVVSSTAHVYGDQTPPCSETDIPRPSRPYETSKLCVDLIAQSYSRSYGMPICIPRLVNVYGPGDKNFSRLIPSVMRDVILNRRPKIWGGDAIRDYLYIDDVIDAYSLLAFTDLEPIKNEIIYNFGSDMKISVEELVNKIIKVSGKKIEIERITKDRKNEIKEQYVDWKKAKIKLKWSPSTNLDTGLKLTYDWYNEKALSERNT